MAGRDPDARGSRAQRAWLDLIYRRHLPWLVRVLRLRFGAEAAEDLAQEAYIRVSVYEEAQVVNARGLLLQVATRAAISEHRKQATRVNLRVVSDDDPAVAAEQAELLALKQAILALPKPVRETFLLSRFAGLTYDEIAVRQGISVKTVEWRIGKALKACAELLRDP